MTQNTLSNTDVYEAVRGHVPRTYFYHHLVPIAGLSRNLAAELMDPRICRLFQHQLGRDEYQEGISLEASELGGLLHDVGYFVDVQDGEIVHRKEKFNPEHVPQGIRVADLWTGDPKVTQAVASHNHGERLPYVCVEAAIVYEMDKAGLFLHPLETLEYFTTWLEFGREKAIEFLLEHGEYSRKTITTDLVKGRYRDVYDNYMKTLEALRDG